MLHITLSPDDRTALDRVRRSLKTPAAVRARPPPQTGPGEGRPRHAHAGSAKKGAHEDRFTLAFLDACGFAPSQPVNYRWTRRGERKRLPYENPQGRRVNVLAAYSPC